MNIIVVNQYLTESLAAESSGLMSSLLVFSSGLTAIALDATTTDGTENDMGFVYAIPMPALNYLD